MTRAALTLGVVLGITACAPARREMLLTGTWELVAASDRHPDGTEQPAYGEHPRGVLIVDRDGRYSLQIFRADRSRFAANVKAQGTPDEFRATVLGESTHFGSCSVNPTSRAVDFRIDAASYPNWNGTTQTRPYTLIGDELRYEVPATAANTGKTPITVWRRVSSRVAR